MRKLLEAGEVGGGLAPVVADGEISAAIARAALRILPAQVQIKRKGPYAEQSIGALNKKNR